MSSVYTFFGSLANLWLVQITSPLKWHEQQTPLYEMDSDVNSAILLDRVVRNGTTFTDITSEIRVINLGSIEKSLEIRMYAILTLLILCLLLNVLLCMPSRSGSMWHIHY